MKAAFIRPSSLDEVVGELLDERAIAIAGGVSLVLLANLGLTTPERLVSLSGVESLRRVGVADDGSIHIGATCTHEFLARDDTLRFRMPELARMFAHIGNNRVRSWGTIGGNLALAEPALDPPVLLNALGASVHTFGPGGSRVLHVGDLADGVMSTVLHHGEILTHVVVPPLAGGEACRYAKFLPRTADDYATVSVAAKLRIERRTVTSARVVCGAVGPVPIVCDRAADALVGNDPLDVEVQRAVADAVRSTVRPTSDHRGSADYKREVAGVFARRVLATFADGPREVAG